jgi:tetratricopeptide (TPR) repeat protein
MGGDAQKGGDTAVRGLRMLEATAHRWLMTKILGWLTEVRAIGGFAEEALQLAERALEIMVNGNVYTSPPLYRGYALAYANLSAADWVRAEQQMMRAFELAERAESQTNLALDYFRYAEILHKKHDLERASENRSEAERLFKELDMPWWLEQARALRGRIERGEPFRGFAPYVDGPPAIW